MAANVVMDPEMESAFAKNTLASFREAFGRIWVTQVRSGDEDLTNVRIVVFTDATSSVRKLVQC